MSNQRIKIGFIGLNPDSHWAAAAHLPALRALSDDFEIIGVANRSPESAQATAKVLGLPYAFDNAQALIDSPEVDLIAVTVKVPFHYDLVKAAIAAGKHVFCEWPLGNGLDEAQELARLAAEKNIVAAIGTQLRYAPEITYLKQLIAEGYVGKVLSTTLVGSGGNWGDKAIADHAYLYKKANGATLQAIPLAHTLVGVTEVLGDIEHAAARMYTNFDQVVIEGTSKREFKDTEDQVLIQGQLKSGAAISVHYRGGMTRGTNLLWEINGTEGDVQVTGDNGHGQMVQLHLRGARGDQQELQPLNLPKEVYKGWPEFPGARNVAHLYALAAEDIRTGSRKAPSFYDAVKLHQLIADLERSANSQC